MTKPSRIVKSAWKEWKQGEQWKRAGYPSYPGSLKLFVAQIRSTSASQGDSDSPLQAAADSWLANKAKARKTRPRRLGLRRGGLL